jgi:AcrR family transcriptional regulator
MYRQQTVDQDRISASMDGDDTTGKRRRTLSRQEIINEALALLEERGVGELSMRRLARRLGVAPNALYTHVHGRADLIDGLVDEVYAGLDLVPDACDDWAEQLAGLSRAVREQLLAHPAVVPLALQHPGPGPHGLRLGEAIYNVLRPAGFSDEAVVGTVSALLTYILGFVALEAPRAGTDQETNDQFVRRLRAFFGALPPRQFPHHVELAPLLARFSSDDQFEFGLRTFLAGLIAEQPELAASRSDHAANVTASYEALPQPSTR